MRSWACMASFIEVPGGDHSGYSRWHAFDHLPEVRALPGIVLGDRFVATPACRSASPKLGSRFLAAHYFCLYLIDSPIPDVLARVGRLSGELRKSGRDFEGRTVLSSFVSNRDGCAVAQGPPMNPDAVPFRPTRGLAVIVSHNDRPIAARLARVGGIAGAWSFPTVGGRLTIGWLDGEPVETAAALHSMAEDSTVEHAATYDVVGTEPWSWFEGEGGEPAAADPLTPSRHHR